MIHLLGCALAISSFTGLSPTAARFQPSPQEVADLYRRYDVLPTRAAGTVRQMNLQHTWLKGDLLVYRRELDQQEHKYTFVDCSTGRQTDAFDHAKLAKDLESLASTKVDSSRLNIRITGLVGSSELAFSFSGKDYLHDFKTGVTRVQSPTSPPANPRRFASPDGKWRYRLTEGKLEVAASESNDWQSFSSETGFTSASWSPDSTHLVASRVIPGDRKMVYRLLSNGKDATRSTLQQTLYDQPGDKLDTAEYWVANSGDWPAKRIEIDPVMCGGQPWANPPRIDWWNPKGSQGWKAMINFPIRGYQKYRVIELDLASAKEKSWVDEESPTFVHTSQIILRRLQNSPALIWRSERSGWGHLYLARENNALKPITSGNFVVRSIQHIDEDAGKILFTANGKETGDPYFVHSYSVNLDGTNLKCLTEGEGTHSTDWSPDRKYFVDTWTSPVQPPRHELRNAQGKLVTSIAHADVSQYRALNIPDPEPFVAKARDGKTDIHGLIYRPSNYDPNLSYPVIEDIYAGPHDSHVPKTFRTASGQQRLAEMGFFVVQIDGMGTANRGKAFHDVCWQNVADAGLPDRILWIKEAAKTRPSMDLERVGIYGTSAGGQSSTGALFFHPEFYKVAVSSCGCHDNRVDKQWWNEQWMGYPVGPHYTEQSNITNAHKLQGQLLLMVGEVDSNVPPESTFRLVDALMAARKDFEFVYLPGLNHTGGGAYGDRKRRDFFVRHLHQVAPLLMGAGR